MNMFSFGRTTREESSPTHQVLKLSLSSPKAKTPRPNDNNNTRGRQNFSSPHNHYNTNSKNAHIMEVVGNHDEDGGVEVCLDHPASSRGGGPASPLDETREPPQIPLRAEAVLAIQHTEVQRFSRMHQSQGCCTTTTTTTTHHDPATAAADWKKSEEDFALTAAFRSSRREHRIPLLGAPQVEASYEDVVALLQHAQVASETAAVQQEMKLLQAEYVALERDQQHLMRLQKQQEQEQKDRLEDPVLALRSPRFSTASLASAAMCVPLNGSLTATSTTPDHAASLAVTGCVTSHLQEILESATLTNGERNQLQSLRGNCWTIHIEAPRFREHLLETCGAKLSQVLKAANHNTLLKPPPDCLTLGPHNCRAGGAATQVRQLHLLGCTLEEEERNTATSRTTTLPTSPRRRRAAAAALASQSSMTGFFLSRDTGKSQSFGSLPNRLFARLRRERQNEATATPPYTTAVSDIQWLVTGPQGSYVCQFTSGELWWGFPSNKTDPQLLRILQTWKIHQVVLGPMTQTEYETYPSWVVVSQDGKVAWKNIPQVLDTQLKSRLPDQPAVDSISLGAGGSYFCRYRDATIDYCLSAQAADVCDYVVANGGTITDIILHSESDSDFVIRHTDLK